MPWWCLQVAGVALHLEQDPQHSHALPASTAPAAAAGAQADWLIDVEAQEHAAASASASTGPAGSAASAAAPPAQAHLANVGLVLWQSGLVLAQLLVERPPFGPAGWAGVHVLDLGAGTGVVGLALARHGAGRVTLTDLPHILPLLARNVEANVGGGAGEAAVVGAAWRVVVAEHRWGEDVAPLLQQVRESEPSRQSLVARRPQHAVAGVVGSCGVQTRCGWRVLPLPSGGRLAARRHHGGGRAVRRVAARPPAGQRGGAVGASHRHVCGVAPALGAGGAVC